MTIYEEAQPTVIEGASTLKSDAEVPYQGFADRKIEDLAAVAIRHPELVQTYAAGVFDWAHVGINYDDLEAAGLKGATPEETITNFVLFRIDEIAANKQSVEAARISRGLDEQVMVKMYKAAREHGDDELVAELRDILGDRLGSIHFSSIEAAFKVEEEDVDEIEVALPEAVEPTSFTRRAKTLASKTLRVLMHPLNSIERFNTEEAQVILQQGQEELTK